MMRTLTVFCKQSTCPSAETLLLYQALDLAAEQAECISTHLGSCEFCDAEFRLLTAHEALEEQYQATEIPAHLRSLAEALMGKRELSTIVSLAEISYEKAGLTLTDA